MQSLPPKPRSDLAEDAYVLTLEASADDIGEFQLCDIPPAEGVRLPDPVPAAPGPVGHALAQPAGPAARLSSGDRPQAVRPSDEKAPPGNFADEAARFLVAAGPAEQRRIAAKLDNCIDPGQVFIDLTRHGARTQGCITSALQSSEFRRIVRSRAGLAPDTTGYVVRWLDENNRVGRLKKRTAWAGGKMKFVGADAYLDSQVPRLAPLVQAAAGLPLSEADALKVSKALLLGFGEETGLCFIDLRRCFGELAKNFGCDGAHRTLSAMMANDKLRLALFNYGSVQAQGLPGMSWKHVRILWPLEEIQQNVRVRPVDGKHPARTESCDAFIVFAARAIEGVADQLDGADDLDAQDVATRLADCFVSVTHEGSRAAVLDLARLERTPYNVVRVVAARKSTGLAGLMQGHARQLGGIAYTVRWADHRNREDFFPNPWPLRARFTCFRPSAEEREDMASRVQTILGVSADKACIVSEKLLEGFGSVETDDKFPRSLCCIDLRPMPAFLESQFGREGRQMMVKLTDHSPKLVGDPSSRSWSNAFGDVRLILPG